MRKKNDHTIIRTEKERKRETERDSITFGYIVQ